MQREGGAAVTSGWTLMLADVVALMLAFFVLTFSMRELVEDDPRSSSGQPIVSAALVEEVVAAGGAATDPDQGVPLALAPNESHTADQLQAPERAAADAPSLAYLAAIIQGDGSLPSLARIRHDDTMLVVELPDSPDDGSGTLADKALRPLLTLAFLARRFDLDLAVALPAGSEATVSDRVARALLLRERIVDATGLAVTPEVTFAAAAPAPSDQAWNGWAALLVKAADGAGGGPTP